MTDQDILNRLKKGQTISLINTLCKVPLERIRKVRNENGLTKKKNTFGTLHWIKNANPAR